MLKLDNVFSITLAIRLISPRSAFCPVMSESKDKGGYSHISPLLSAGKLLTNFSDRISGSLRVCILIAESASIEEPSRDSAPLLIVMGVSLTTRGFFVLKREESRRLGISRVVILYIILIHCMI